MEHRFNLASDPWIPVYDKNLDQKLVSLRDLLAHSDIYRIDLSDIALMRFIAAAHWTVRYREGAGLPIGKRLPAAWVDDYLDRWHDRFDLEADPTPRATKTGRQTIVETAESAADAALRLIQLRFKPFGLHAMTCDGPLFPMFDDLDVPAIANDRPVWERTGLEGDAPTGPLDVLTWESRRITVSRTKTGQYLLLERADRRPEPTGQVWVFDPTLALDEDGRPCPEPSREDKRLEFPIVPTLILSGVIAHQCARHPDGDEITTAFGDGWSVDVAPKTMTGAGRVALLFTEGLTRMAAHTDNRMYVKCIKEAWWKVGKHLSGVNLNEDHRMAVRARSDLSRQLSLSRTLMPLSPLAAPAKSRQGRPGVKVVREGGGMARRVFDSMADAVRWLQEQGRERACRSAISRAVSRGVNAYGMRWATA